MSALRILVTDDHPLTREGLSLAARAAVTGVQVDSAGSVAEAAGMIDRRGPYRLILLDFALPDSHGYAGMLRLQQLAPTTPIVIVTAHERISLIEAAKALGAAGFVLKSEPLDDIAAALRKIAAGRTHFPEGVTADPLIAAARERIELSCPLLSGPLTMTVWIKEGTTNACQEAQARGDHREAA